MTGQIAIADCSHLVGHVKHEMMHIMGFYHEHSRYISLHIQNNSNFKMHRFSITI